MEELVERKDPIPTAVRPRHRMTRSGLMLATIALLVNPGCMAELPSSERAQAAIERVSPRLKDALEDRGLDWGVPIFVRIFKESRELEIWVDKGERFDLFRTYEICTFSGGLGPKLRTGDKKSPEGFYFVTPGRMNPASKFHLSFNLGFPNAFDRAHDRTGSALMVHGNCVSIGCYAMTDPKIEEIYAMADAALSNGQPFFRVHAFPYRMTEENMTRHRRSEWIAFWRDLKQGYDHFEATGRPPNVEVIDGRYVFDSD